MQRVSVYIDGFNLYYGLRDRGWRRYYWLDLHQMAGRLLRPGQTLAKVRYFTAEIVPQPGAQGARVRQDTYLKVLASLPNLSIHYGRFLPRQANCRHCGATWTRYEEKMTDVNIAVELLGDAQDDTFDTAIIISGDGDLSGPVQAVRRRYPDKRVIIAFPPRRHSIGLRNVATGAFTIGRDVFRDSQFPEQVIQSDGYVLMRPANWR